MNVYLNRYIPFIIAFLLLTCLNLNGQNYYFKHYKVEDGLSHNTINSIIQDHNGFLWFGTKDGLNRFDGYTFKVFRNALNNSKSIGSNFIRTLHEYNGYLWIGTDNGLFRYTETNDSFELITTSYNKPILDIDHDHNGNLWFIAGGLLTKINGNNISSQGETFDMFYSTLITSSANGTIWAASQNNLYQYIADNNSFKKTNIALPKPESKNPIILTALHAKGTDTILIGTKDHGALCYDVKLKQSKTLLSKSYNSLFVRSFLTVNNQIWIGNESGIYIFDETTGNITHLHKNHNSPYSLSDNAVYSMITDNEGGIWVSTYFGGANYYPKQFTPIQKFFPKVGENSISGNAVREIKKDNVGNLWIGTEDAGLNKYDIKTGKFTNYTPVSSKKSISHYNIHGLLTDKDKLWIGTFEHGLDVLDLHTGNILKHYSSKTAQSQMRSDFILYIYKTTSSNDLFLLTSQGIYIYNQQNDNFLLYEGFPESYHYTQFIEDKNETLWAGSYWDGLFFYNQKNKKKGVYKYQKNNPNSLSSNLVNGLFIDSNNNLWITTENGLNRFRKDTNDFERFTVSDGLPSNVTYSILEDDNSNLWISTSKGMAKFNPKTNKIQVFTKVHGLLSDQFNYNSSFKDDDGTMYFGSVNGMVKFHPKDFSTNNYHPAVLLTNLKINNETVSAYSQDSPLDKSITFSDAITLSNKQSTFTIEFASLGFTTPEITEYWYKLENLNNNWIPLGKNHEVSFTELAAGDYTFKVKSMNSQGVWSNESKALKITITPHFLASKWALTIYFLLASIIIYTLLSYYHNLTKNKNERKILQLQNEKEKEIYEAKIDFFTNIAHEIRTPLTLIKSPLDKLLKNNSVNDDVEKNLSIMEKNTARLIDLSNQLLDFRKAEKQNVHLNFSETNLNTFLNEIYTRFIPSIEEKQISFKLILPDQPVVAFVDTEILIKILSNLLSNAIKYSEKKVRINLNTKENWIKITINNDGKVIPKKLQNKIFEPFYRVSTSKDKQGTGIGLSLSHSLTELHGGHLYFNKKASTYNSFILKIPFIKEQKNINIKEKKVEKVSKEYIKPFKKKKSSIKIQHILLVEDNHELSDFIKSELSEKYQVTTAVNGKEALEIVMSKNISIIISDIMMPIMDGITLCSKIKATTETKHIPVILLTAKNSLNAKITGLESGADAYVSKPFSIDYLNAQIDNLLANRKSILELYSNSPLAHLKQVELSKIDANFIEKLDKIVKENLSNTQLDIDFLANKLNMSRSTLYRKIKSTSNMSPNELINISRLKKAAVLLKTTNLRVYEISEKVGYTSQVSFGRNFLKYFKVTPTVYIQQAKDKSTS